MELFLFGFAGSEQALTSEQVATDIKMMRSQLDSVTALLHESHSRTRAASTINVDDLRVLRKSLDIVRIPEEEAVTLTELLGPETEGGESFW